MIIAYDYEVDYDPGKEVYFIRNKQPELCPTCRVKLVGYDHRKRKVIGNDGHTYLFRLRRLRCPKCLCLHIECPDLIKPFKHYSSETIRMATTEKDSSCPADDSTIRRWKMPKK